MSDYLSHHGVDGQKWGVRNGPPYPLDAEARKQARINRASNRFQRMDNRIQKKQNKTLKYAKRAEFHENSILGSEKKADKYNERARSTQIKLNKSLRRGKKTYDRLVKRYGKDSLPNEVNEIGKRYTDQLILQNNLRYMR